MQAGTGVHEVPPSCVLAGEERREVKRVLKVDAPVFRHSCHLLPVNPLQVLPLDEHINEEVPQPDKLYNVAGNLQQARDVRTELFRLEPRLRGVSRVLLQL